MSFQVGKRARNLVARGRLPCEIPDLLQKIVEKVFWELSLTKNIKEARVELSAGIINWRYFSTLCDDRLSKKTGFAFHQGVNEWHRQLVRLHDERK